MNLNVDSATNRIVTGRHSYDANGNLTAMPSLSMSCDVENRVIQTVQTQNGTASYRYNPWNQRVWSSTGTGETVTMYGPNGERIADLTVVVNGSQLILLFVPASADSDARPNVYFPGADDLGGWRAVGYTWPIPSAP
jgi:hypothetical protein